MLNHQNSPINDVFKIFPIFKLDLPHEKIVVGKFPTSMLPDTTKSLKFIYFFRFPTFGFHLPHDGVS